MGPIHSGRPERATWIRDCLIGGSAMSRAIDRLQGECQSGIRHFSAIGVAVPLDKAQSVESDLCALEAELEVFERQG